MILALLQSSGKWLIATRMPGRAEATRGIARPLTRPRTANPTRRIEMISRRRPPSQLVRKPAATAPRMMETIVVMLMMPLPQARRRSVRISGRMPYLEGLKNVLCVAMRNRTKIVAAKAHADGSRL
jgi:hypothetical protein